MLLETKPELRERPRAAPLPAARGAAASQPQRLAAPRPNSGETVRRVVDVTLALLLASCTWPLLLAAIALVRLTSRGPALYSQTRLGRGGKPFRIYKVRTMAYDCERGSGPRWSTAGDPRVLPVGRLLRRTHLDELPQLWNVLCGEMSLVGPRPERPEFVPQLE